jgi:hypothetical protein
MGWVYFFGDAKGEDVKIGRCAAGKLSERLRAINGDQMGRTTYILLAAIRGTRTHEQDVHKYFAEWQRNDLGNNQEYFYASPPVVEYINWLRQQWWVTLDANEEIHDVAQWTATRPTPDRRVPAPESDPGRLVQVNRAWHGDLAGTAWDWMSTPEPIGEDYYTPSDLVRAARVAMGDIDLDPASHWRANREHKISTYYTIHRSAFQNPWFGRVWLNPPYGDNAPWFGRILEFEDQIEQLCFLSPAWVFTALQARPFMERSSAAVMLSPTPPFWGHPSGRTGTNHPHLIVYMGNRKTDFIAAFRPYGIPVHVLLDAAPRHLADLEEAA